MHERDLNPIWQLKLAERGDDSDIMVEDGMRIEIKSSRTPASTGLTYAMKNRMVDDMGKLVFDRRFKGFINHKEEILNKNSRRREMIRSGKLKGEEEPDEFIVEDDVLSNTDEDFEYHNAEDMQNAYA